MSEKNCKVYQELLMGLMDKELTPEEAREVNEHLIRCSACREEYDQLAESSQRLQGLRYLDPDEHLLERIWKSPYSRFSRNAALWLIGLGILLLMGLGLFTAITAPGEELLPRIGIGAVLLGSVILLVSAVRDRIRSYRTDPYNEVKR